MINFNIVSTGSKGNAVILEDFILIDCGVPFSHIKKYISSLKLALLTHIHSDHFKMSTIKRLAFERPSLRFACCRWLVQPLVQAGVNPKNIDVLDFDIMYNYGLCNVIAVPLNHNVPNVGYKIHFPKGRVFYATDTNDLKGIVARHYDLYMIEANYEDEVIQEKIKAKEIAGLYAYEKQVLKNHLSKAKADDFIIRMSGPNSRFCYLHCHDDTEDE